VTDQTIREYFCLTENRANFDLDPSSDSEFLFGDPRWAEDVDKRLQRSIVMGRPFRLVWWGQYGIGKTHRLRYAKKLIEKNGYSYYPCFTIAADLEDKSGFERLHSQLVGSIGFDKARAFTEAYILRLRNGEPLKSIVEIAESAPDVATAIDNLGSHNSNVSAASWRYLIGQKLTANEMALAGTGKQAIDTSFEFAAVHAVLAHIIEHQANGKKLLYLVDEIENLTKIKNKNAAARWQESIRSLLDVKNVGIVFAVGADNMQGIPSVLLMPDIVRRFQKDNYEQMAAYKTATAERFVRDLLGSVIDKACRAAKEASNGWASGSEDYDSELYPFTKSAFDVFCNNATNDPRTAKPSEILNALNNAAYEALQKESKLITQDILHTMGMS
jgi:hypothetical protein